MPVGVKARQHPAHSKRKYRRRRVLLEDPYPNWPLRRLYLERIELGWTTLSEVAQAVCNGDRLDTSWVERQLGLRLPPASNKNGVRYEQGMRTHVEREAAVQLVRAMGGDPSDIRYPGAPRL